MTNDDQFRQFIESGSVEAMDSFLLENADFANKKIYWGEGGKNITDPLHYVSDCVFNGLLMNGTEGEIAKVLLKHGAEIDGNDGAESPLIGATSLSAVKVAEVLLEEGANIELVSVFGANALHWAAYVGMSIVVDALLKRGAALETKCTEFSATPLFWAVQGFSKYGPPNKSDQVGAAKALVEAGADVHTRNIEGVSALARSMESESDLMSEILIAGGAV